MTRLLTIPQAAEVLNVSTSHIYQLIYEADATKQSRWKHGREIITLSQKTLCVGPYASTWLPSSRLNDFPAALAAWFGSGRWHLALR